jgi:hypothetical protein
MGSRRGSCIRSPPNFSFGRYLFPGPQSRKSSIRWSDSSRHLALPSLSRHFPSLPTNQLYFGRATTLRQRTFRATDTAGPACRRGALLRAHDTFQPLKPPEIPGVTFLRCSPIFDRRKTLAPVCATPGNDELLDDTTWKLFWREWRRHDEVGRGSLPSRSGALYTDVLSYKNKTTGRQRQSPWRRWSSFDG